MTSSDVIVVGSGASAVHAAWRLVEAGLRVVMLDVGMRDEHYAPLIPAAPFTMIRRTDREQHRYFLGDRFEGVPFGAVRVGAQLTPPRAFMARDVDRLTPVDAEGFHGMESLALGGLAAGWGAGVTRFTADDLAGSPVTVEELAPHYAAVEQRIGVSGVDDDLTPELGLHASMMPPLPTDTPSRRLLGAYEQARARCQRAGLRMGVSRLAACSQPWRGRGPHPLNDLDFFSDVARAVYRPRWTLDELAASPNFTYVPAMLVLRFTEQSDRVTVVAQRVGGGEERFESRALVLAAGVFGTARIVLRSLAAYEQSVPYVTNPYTYAPCIQPRMVGCPADDARHSLVQLTATFTPPGSGWPPMHISVYSYRSLLTFKLIKESPLSARAGRRLFPSLIPLISILGMHHADEPASGKEVALVPARNGAPERLRITHHIPAAVAARIERHERLLLRALRRLGCVALRRIRPGAGSSIHYAGTFPMAHAPGPLRTSRTGLLSGTRAVYLADGSLLERLPAKGLTLTLMANADRVGALLAASL